jgi:tRNA(fMet)-specific endonuclease VapC
VTTAADVDVLGGNDMLNAAHALSLDLVWVTANIRALERVAGLKVENWLE